MLLWEPVPTAENARRRESGNHATWEMLLKPVGKRIAVSPLVRSRRRLSPTSLTAAIHSPLGDHVGEEPILSGNCATDGESGSRATVYGGTGSRLPNRSILTAYSAMSPLGMGGTWREHAAARGTMTMARRARNRWIKSVSGAGDAS